MNSNNVIDLDALHYEKNSSSQYASVQKLLAELDIRSNFLVLDVGCGFGNIAAEISEKVPLGKVIGIDASENMIDLAKKRFSVEDFPNLEFYKIKAEDIRFEKGSFDVILCANTLLWVRKPKKALKTMCKALKEGGTLSILTYCNNTPYACLFSEVLNKYFVSFEHISAGKTMLSKEEHKQILTDEKMVIEEFLVEDNMYRYENTQALRDYVKGWLNCYVLLPEKLRENFLDRIVEESSKYNVSKIANEIAIPHQSLTIRARKREIEK